MKQARNGDTRGETCICAGLKKDAGDGRASSFLSMLQRIPELKHPPTYLLVENVVGFEVSFFRAFIPRAVSSGGNVAGFNESFFMVIPPRSNLVVETWWAAKRAFSLFLPNVKNGVVFEVNLFPSVLLELSPSRRRGGL